MCTRAISAPPADIAVAATAQCLYLTAMSICIFFLFLFPFTASGITEDDRDETYVADGPPLSPQSTI